MPSAFIQQALHSYAGREFWGVNESDDRQPRIAFEVNVRGTYNLLEACRNSPDAIEKAIVASSDKACGDSPHLPYTEDMPSIGRHAYDCSKSCQEQVGTRHCRNSAMEL